MAFLDRLLDRLEEHPKTVAIVLLGIVVGGAVLGSVWIKVLNAQLTSRTDELDSIKRQHASELQELKRTNSALLAQFGILKESITALADALKATSEALRKSVDEAHRKSLLERVEDLESQRLQIENTVKSLEYIHLLVIDAVHTSSLGSVHGQLPKQLGHLALEIFSVARQDPLRPSQVQRSLDLAMQRLTVLGETTSEAATTLDNIGSIYLSSGRVEEAEETFRRALELRRYLGDRHGSAVSFANLGQVLEAQGKLHAALQSTRNALALYEQLGAGSSAEASLTYYRTARLQARLGEQESSYETLFRGIESVERLGTEDRDTAKRLLELYSRSVDTPTVKVEGDSVERLLRKLERLRLSLKEGGTFEDSQAEPEADH